MSILILIIIIIYQGIITYFNTNLNNIKIMTNVNYYIIELFEEIKETKNVDEEKLKHIINNVKNIDLEFYVKK